MTSDASTGAGLVGELRAEAERMGFSLTGVAAPEATAHMPRYRDWIARGLHGEMAYLERADSVARRADLRGTMEEVRSVVVVAHEYYQPDPPGVPDDASLGVIARYARGDDYHDVVKQKLVELLRWLDARVEGGVRGRPYVDTGPILERDLGRRAGLGWFGKNTMLIHPKRGSYFFVGLLLVDTELPTDAPFQERHCGSCRACLDACPTGALLGYDEQGAPVMDARRCISYLTIEHRGPIPRALRPLVGNRIFGCDICQEVCPWNERFARPATEARYAAREEVEPRGAGVRGATTRPTGPAHQGTAAPSLTELLAMDEDAWRAFSRRSPVRRARRAGFLRNVAVALGNGGSPDAVPALAAALDDEEALVRGHAAWALGRIGGRETRAPLRAALTTEREPWVREEIEAALAE